MKRAFNIVGIGEILFDIFGEEAVPGGAPFNFAYYAQSLGMNGIIASCIGDDAYGKRLETEVLPSLGMTTDYLQHHAERPTGTVNVPPAVNCHSNSPEFRSST